MVGEVVENVEVAVKEAEDVEEWGKADDARQFHASFPAEIDPRRFQFLDEWPQEFGTRESRRFHPQHPIFAVGREGDKTKSGGNATTSFRDESSQGVPQARAFQSKTDN